MRFNVGKNEDERIDEVDMTTRGHCLCGATAWEFAGEKTWSCYCHCDDCRRNCAAPIIAWLGVPLKRFKWVGQVPKTYQSSNGVYRLFCDTCGSQLGFEADHFSGGMNLYAASLENHSDFTPTFHVNYQSKLPWLEMHAELTKHSGKLLESTQDIIDYQQGAFNQSHAIKAIQ